MPQDGPQRTQPHTSSDYLLLPPADSHTFLSDLNYREQVPAVQKAACMRWLPSLAPNMCCIFLSTGVTMQCTKGIIFAMSRQASKGYLFVYSSAVDQTVLTSVMCCMHCAHACALPCRIECRHSRRGVATQHLFKLGMLKALGLCVSIKAGLRNLNSRSGKDVLTVLPEALQHLFTRAVPSSLSCSTLQPQPILCQSV